MSRDVALAFSGPPPNLDITWRDFYAFIERVEIQRAVEKERRKRRRARCSMVICYGFLLA